MRARKAIGAVHMPVCETCGQSVALARPLAHASLPPTIARDAPPAGTRGEKSALGPDAGIPPPHFSPKPPGGGGKSFGLENSGPLDLLGPFDLRCHEQTR